LDSGRPFIAETVFSHSSKLDLVREARAAGFEVHLHVILVPVDLSVARVRARVENGGHDVPEHKIRERHDRLWAFVAEAVLLANETHFWANHRTGPEHLGGFADGLQIGSLTWPSWVHPDLPKKLGGTVEG
jgi:predicted ABC-type ATPase